MWYTCDALVLATELTLLVKSMNSVIAFFGQSKRRRAINGTTYQYILNENSATPALSVPSWLDFTKRSREVGLLRIYRFSFPCPHPQGCARNPLKICIRISPAQISFRALLPTLLWLGCGLAKAFAVRLIPHDFHRCVGVSCFRSYSLGLTCFFCVFSFFLGHVVFSSLVRVPRIVLYRCDHKLL